MYPQTLYYVQMEMFLSVGQGPSLCFLPQSRKDPAESCHWFGVRQGMSRAGNQSPGDFVPTRYTQWMTSLV